MPAGHRERIRATQPFVSGAYAERHWLARLQTLANNDKHHVLPVVEIFHAVAAAHVDIVLPGASLPLTREELMRRYKFSEIAHTTISTRGSSWEQLATFVLSPRTKDLTSPADGAAPEMRLNVKVGIEPAFGEVGEAPKDDQLMLSCLGTFIDRANEIIVGFIRLRFAALENGEQTNRERLNPCRIGANGGPSD